jgi:hypothetical protein
MPVMRHAISRMRGDSVDTADGGDVVLELCFHQ